MINQTRIKECATSIINEPDVSTALETIYGSEINKDEKHNFVVLFINSILAEMISAEPQVYKNNEPKTFAKGIVELLEKFDYSFTNKEILLKQMRIFCKNYKFIPKNKINDYAIFFFTFKSFDYYCKNCENETEKYEIAAQFAKKAYFYLKRPHKKTPVLITSNTLLKFTGELPINAKKEYLYTLIFISFIQAIYNSKKISALDKFCCFQRFDKHILFLNIILHYKFIDITKSHKIEMTSPRQVSKSISKIKSSLKKNGEIEKVRELERIVKTLKKLPKSSTQALKKPKKELQSIYNEVSSLLFDEVPRRSAIFTKVLYLYMGLPFDDNGEEVSLLNQVFEYLKFSFPRSLKDTFGNHSNSKENIYIQLLLPNIPAIENESKCLRNAITYRDLCDALIAYIKFCVDEKFYIDGSDEIRKNYNTAVENNVLKNINTPILSIDITNNIIDHKIKYISNIIN